MDIPLPGEEPKPPVVIDIPLPAPKNCLEISIPPPASEPPKVSPVLGKLQAKKRLLAFSLSKQAATTGAAKVAAAPVQVHTTPVLSFGFNKTSPLKVSSAQAFHGNDDADPESLVPPASSPQQHNVKKKRRKDSEPSAMEEIKREEERMREALYPITLTERERERLEKRRRQSREHRHDFPRDSKPGKKSSKEVENQKETNPDKHSKSQEKAADEEKGDRRRQRSSGERPADPLQSDLPSSWLHMKQSGLDLEEVRRLQKHTSGSSSDCQSSGSKRGRSHERKHRSSSSSSSSRRGWSAEPRMRQPFVAASAHGESEEREYPQHMVKFTKCRPSLSYCENPLTVPGYYTSRTDLFSSTSPPLVEIMQEFINSSALAIEELNSSGLAALQVSYDGDDASDEEPSSPKKPERLWYVKDDEINTLASLNLLGSPLKENAEPTGEKSGEASKSKWDSDYESEHGGSQKSELAPAYEEFLNTLGLELPGEEAAKEKQKRRRKVDTKKRAHEEMKESSEEPPAKKERSDKKRKKKSKKKVEASSSEEEPAKSRKKKAKKKVGKRGRSSDKEVTKSKKKKKSEDDSKERHKSDEDRKRRKKKKSSEKHKKKKKKRKAEKSDEECREPTDANSEDSSSSNAEEKMEHLANLDASSNSSTFSTDFKPATAFSDGGSSPEQGIAELAHIAEVSIPLPPDTPPSKPVPAPSNIYSPSQMSSQEEDSDDATHNWDSSMSLPDTFATASNLYQIPMPVPPPSVPLTGVPPPSVPLPGVSPSSVPLPGVPPSNVPLPGVPPPNVPLPGVPPPNVPLPGVPPPNVPLPGVPPSSVPLPGVPASSVPPLSDPLPGVPASSVSPSNAPASNVSPSNVPVTGFQIPLSARLEFKPMSVKFKLKKVAIHPEFLEEGVDKGSVKQEGELRAQDDQHPYLEGIVPLSALKVVPTEPSEPEKHSPKQDSSRWGPLVEVMAETLQTSPQPLMQEEEKVATSPSCMFMNPECKTPSPKVKPKQESSAESNKSPGKVDRRTRSQESSEHRGSDERKHHSKRSESWKVKRGPSPDRLKPRRGRSTDRPRERLHSPPSRWSPNRGRVKSPQASWSPRHRSPRPRSPEYPRGKFHSRSPTHRPCTTERHRFVRSGNLSSASPDRLRESSPRSSGFRHRSPHDRTHKRSPRRSPLHSMSPHRMSPLRNRSPRPGSPSFKRSPRGSPVHTRSPVAMRNRSPMRSRSPRGASPVRGWSPRAESPVRNRSPRGGSPVRNMSPPSSRASRGGPPRSRSPLPASRNRSPGDSVSSLRNRSPRRSLTPLWNRSPEFRPRTPPHRPRSPCLSPRHQSPRHWPKLRSPSPHSSRRPRSPLSPCHRLLPHHGRRKHWSPSPLHRHRGGYLEYEDKAGEADMDLSSPASSPLVGLKRSVADSTISDSELASSNYYEKQYPEHFYQEEEEVRSPRRLSLDERIDLELGVKKEQPIPVYQQQGYYPSQFQQYYSGQEDGPQYFESQQHSSLIQVQAEGSWDNPEDFIGSQNQQPSRVLQVGNVLQVVPSEDLAATSQQPTSQPPTLPHPTSSQVLQVGNIIQVVPVTQQQQQQQQVISVPLPVPPAPRPPLASPTQLSAKEVAEQRRLAKEKRRQEKDNRHKERTERRKTRIALRLKEVNQAWADVPSASQKNSIVLEGDMDAEEMRLIQEAMSETPSEEKVVKPRNRPQKTVRRHASREPVLHVNLPSVEKGILVSPGFREKPLDAALIGVSALNKSVTFADGIRPGEGTSPSGGEDMPSPPPPPRKLPKEKRFTKTVSSVGEALSATKKHKRKKVKVKIVRQISAAPPEEEEKDEEDMPPPPPPPGSPPPYLKQYYQQFQAAFIQPAPQTFTTLVVRTAEQPPLPPAAPAQFAPPPPSNRYVMNYNPPPPTNVFPFNPVNQIMNAAKLVVEKNNGQKRTLLPTPPPQFLPPPALPEHMVHEPVQPLPPGHSPVTLPPQPNPPGTDPPIPPLMQTPILLSENIPLPMQNPPYRGAKSGKKKKKRFSDIF